MEKRQSGVPCARVYAVSAPSIDDTSTVSPVMAGLDAIAPFWRRAQMIRPVSALIP